MSYDDFVEFWGVVGWNLGSAETSMSLMEPESGFRVGVSGLGFRVQGWGLGLSQCGLEFRVQSLECRVFEAWLGVASGTLNPKSNTIPNPKP